MLSRARETPISPFKKGLKESGEWNGSRKNLPKKGTFGGLIWLKKTWLHERANLGKGYESTPLASHVSSSLSELDSKSR
ncbi:hypothetical protein AKJ41_03530 [candidate division MSBL1 archaeon SCGC-AAA259O05]|uniref:Uncharacterized protein n=2 Tax=candidate division MSBL1 TaxID=215777 RepID=A0A133V3A4_9EURY|nr:hypothetical protein AKJ64_01840 [candidate division MSBL1 archaeon SCGC-AAA259E17]KXB00909.1 hypothetical protein AKJ41_03530 [candidate division MSBL1 archaeon SCGC-AAA259O05]